MSPCKLFNFLLCSVLFIESGCICPCASAAEVCRPRALGSAYLDGICLWALYIYRPCSFAFVLLVWKMKTVAQDGMGSVYFAAVDLHRKRDGGE